MVNSSSPVGWRELLKRAAATSSLLVLGVIVGMAWLALFGSGSTPFVFTDLDYYRAALRVVVAPQPLYAALPYPPVAVVVIAWLAGFSPIQGNQLWMAMSLALALALVVVLAKRSFLPAGTTDGSRRWEWTLRASVTGILLAFSMPLVSQLANGQVTLVIIALAFFDVARVLPRRFQGVLVGVAGAIKLTPLIFVPYYLVTGQRRQALNATGAFAAVTAVGFLIFPSDSLFFWAHLGKSDQFGDPARTDNLSIHSILARWLPALGSSAVVYGLLALALAAVALWRARQHYQRGEWMSAALVVGASSVVMAPISWPHYHVWVVLAGLWMLLGRRPLGWAWGGVVFVVYSMPFNLILIAGMEAGSRLAVLGDDLMVLIPIAIGIWGLPHQLGLVGATEAVAANESAAGLSAATPSSAVADE